MRISDWSSDVCSSDLLAAGIRQREQHAIGAAVVEPLARRPARLLAQEQLEIGVITPETGQDARQHERRDRRDHAHPHLARSEEHTSELQSLMRISYAVFCLKKKKNSIHTALPT